MAKLVNDGHLQLRMPKSLIDRLQDCADANSEDFPSFMRALIERALMNKEKNLRDKGLLLTNSAKHSYRYFNHRENRRKALSRRARKFTQ